MKQFAVAIFLAILIHAVLGAALICYLNYGSRRPNLSELDFSSVELSFAESAAEKEVEMKSAAEGVRDINRVKEEGDKPILENLSKEVSDAVEDLPPEVAPFELPNPVEEVEELPEVSAAEISPIETAEIKTPPRMANARIRPSYPRESREKGEEGKVVLDVVVSVEGRAEKVTIVESSGFERLDEAAKKAVGAARFWPARTEDGEATAAVLRIPLVFKLK